MTEQIKAFQPIKGTMGGGDGPMPFVYLDRRAAEIWVEGNKEDWTSYKIKEVDLRIFNNDEGAVGAQLVQIRRVSAIDLIRARAIKKLTSEELEAIKSDQH